MPVSRNNILIQQDLEGWKYLEGVKVPSLEAEVELLIGTNAKDHMVSGLYWGGSWMVRWEVVSHAKTCLAILLSLPIGSQRPSYRHMQKCEFSIQLDEGHYCFDFPFKAEDIVLPTTTTPQSSVSLVFTGSSRGTKIVIKSTQLSSPKSLKRVTLILYHISSWSELMARCAISSRGIPSEKENSKSCFWLCCCV